jgi:hypothetical protein
MVMAATRSPAWVFVLTAAMLALTGCASVPQASRERDADAKRYITHPQFATLYVYRDDFAGDISADNSVLYVDGRIIGGTLPGGYFRIDVRPGSRVLHGDGPDQGRITVKTAASEIAFVALNVAGGTSRFRQVDPETAKRDIARCCVLLENWAPGQRPLLR